MREQALSSRLLTQQLSSPIAPKGPAPDQKEHIALKGTINAIKNPVQNQNYKQSATEAPKQDKPRQVKEAHITKDIFWRTLSDMLKHLRVAAFEIT